MMHNLISVLIFTVVVWRLGLHIVPQDKISYMLSEEFFWLFLKLILISLIGGLIGRIVAYFFLSFWYKEQEIRIESIGTLNKGMNRIPSWTWLFSIVLSSFAFAVGLFEILQDRLFGREDLFVLIAIYLLIKIGIYIIVKITIGFKA